MRLYDLKEFMHHSCHSFKMPRTISAFQDRGLQRLGTMVHALDVGGVFVPEANGFEAMISGARQRAIDDDQLLAEIGVVLDSLYAYFSNDPQPNKENA